MGVEARDLAKLATGAMFAAVALQYLWKTVSAKDDERIVYSAHTSPTSSPKKQAVEANSTKQRPEDGVWIYFASQSGTAEIFSKEIEEECSQKEVQATVVDLEDFDENVFVEHRVVVMVIATYGEGDPTDNSVQFFKWLEDKNHPDDLLGGVQFTVMGLGNRQYIHFNATSQVCDDRMAELGAERIYDLGVGDDDANIVEDFEQWKENGFWPAIVAATGGSIERQLSMPDDLLTADKVLADLQLRAQVVADPQQLKPDPLVQQGGADILGKWFFQAHKVLVRNERELRQVSDFKSGKSSKHLDIDITSAPSLDWKTADNLEILPRNTKDVVDWFAQKLGVQDKLDCTFSFARAEGVDRPVKKPFPTPCSVRDALAQYCDLIQVPAKGALKKLAALAVEQSEQDRVEALINDRPAYQWAIGPDVRMNFQEFWELFLPSLKIDLGTFLQLCPRLKYRPYTIASSSREDRHTIGVCVSVVQETLIPIGELLAGLKAKGHDAPGAAAYSHTSEGRNFVGLCSSMLCGRVGVGTKLLVAARASTFRLPKEATAPVIMVGAGTGMAPFRGFVREFHSEAGIRPKTMLIFGCQKENSDFLYREELRDSLKPQGERPKVLGELVTAFSREQEHKIYVQHRLRDRSADVKAMMRDGGHIYVCGSNAMGASIREVMNEIVGSADLVQRLLTEGRYVEELW